MKAIVVVLALSCGLLVSNAWAADQTPTVGTAANGDAPALKTAAETIGYAEIPDNPEAISLGGQKDVTISQEGEVVTFAFTPQSSGDYYFTSIGALDTRGCVLTRTKLIGSSDDYSVFEDDHNFRVYFHADAGVTYYLQTRIYGSGTGSYAVTIGQGTKPIGDAEIPDNPESISLGEQKTVNITQGGEVVTFAFTPQSSGDYYFTSFGTLDTGGCVLTQTKLIGSNNGYSVFDSDYNFRVYFHADAGTMYYLQARMANINDTGSFTVQLAQGTKPFGFAEIPDNPEAIALGEQKDVTINPGGEIATFAFTPQSSGDYYFTSFGAIDTFGCVVTQTELIGTNDNYSNFEDDENFRVYFHADAGTTYYLQVRLEDISDTGSFAVGVVQGKKPVGFAEIPANPT
ncbi:MAG: hypothetical protein Q4C36_09535, partial [Coriobacteriia bacterium]|nr:hypothetical protein [Coriobacteriia bacterium]